MKMKLNGFLSSWLCLPIFISSFSLGCNRSGTLSKKACRSVYGLGDESCHHLYVGRRHTEDLTLSLNAGSNPNVVLVPVEVARAMAVLIQATGDLARNNEHQQRIEEIRCYLLSTTSRWSESVLRVPRRKKTHRHVTNPLLVDPPLMEARRHIFADIDLKADVNYTRRAFCWYDFETTNLNFADHEPTTKTIRDWISTEVNGIHSHLAIPQSSQPTSRMEIISSKSKALVLSVIGLNIPWRENLFHDNNGEAHDFHLNNKEKVKAKMIKSTRTSFNFLETQLFVSVAVPLSQNLSNIGGGTLILIRPKDLSGIEQIKDDIFQNSVQLHAFMENAKNAKLINTTLVVPRLSLSISQEWTSHASKVIGNESVPQDDNQDESNMMLLGGTVQVRQDVVLHFHENIPFSGILDETTPSISHDFSDPMGDDETFNLDVPFLFVLALDMDVVAIGQILDPLGGSKAKIVPTEEANVIDTTLAPSWLDSIFG